MLDTWEQAFLVKYMIEFLEGEDEGDEGTMMRRKMVFMKDFLITCLGCPRPDLRYQTSESVIKTAEFLVSQILSY